MHHTPLYNVRHVITMYNSNCRNFSLYNDNLDKTSQFKTPIEDSKLKSSLLQVLLILQFIIAFPLCIIGLVAASGWGLGKRPGLQV